MDEYDILKNEESILFVPINCHNYDFLYGDAVIKM